MFDHDTMYCGRCRSAIKPSTEIPTFVWCAGCGGFCKWPSPIQVLVFRISAIIDDMRKISVDITGMSGALAQADPLNHGAQASMNLNAETAALCKKYGAPRVDYFIGGTWRLWWTELHTHPGVGISSGLSSQGSTLEEAIARMKDHIAKYVVQKGGNCRLGWPEYSEDLY